MENDDTETGGEALSIEQAASAFAKATTEGAGDGQPEEDMDEQGEADDELQASDEDAGDEEGEDDPEGQDDDEDDQEPESDQGRFVASNGKVKLPDGTVSTVADLISGNLRDRDYRQKTMDLAEQRRAFEEQSSAFKASQQQVNEQREYLAKLLETIVPQPPDATLLESDPFGYLQQKEHHERFAQHLTYLQQQQATAHAEAEKAAEQERLKRANAEWEKLQGAIPALRDTAKLNAFAADLQSAGEAYGFSQSEIASAVPLDHRMALVLRDAARWRKLQASKPTVQKKVENRPPVQKSGKRLTPDAQKAQRAADAVNRLKSSGSVEDAALAYLASRKG